MNSELVKLKFEDFMKKSTNLGDENNMMLELQILKILVLIKCSHYLYTGKYSLPVCLLEQSKLVLLFSNNCPNIHIYHFS